MVTVVPRPRDRDREPPQRMPQYPTPRTPRKQQRHPAAAATHPPPGLVPPGRNTPERPISALLLLRYSRGSNHTGTTHTEKTPQAERNTSKRNHCPLLTRPSRYDIQRTLTRQYSGWA